MKSHDLLPSSAWADAYLVSLVQVLKSRGITQLPPLRDCAREAGVSFHVMHDAIKRLENKGLLRTRHGDGVYLAGEGPHERKKQVHESKEKWLFNKIVEDIKNGRFSADEPLPSIKELKVHYGAGYRTIKNVLENLVQSRVLEPFKRSYRALRPQEHKTLSAIVLVYPQGAKHFPKFLTNNYMTNFDEPYRVLDDLCRQRHIRLFCLGFHPDTGTLSDLNEKKVHLNSSTLDGHQVLGVIIFMQGMEYTVSLDTFIRKVSVYGFPISVFNRSEKTFDQMIKGKNIRIFCAGQSHDSGRRVAKYLFDKGHKRLVYLSPFHHLYEWSQKRLAGMNEIFEEICEDGKIFLVNASYPSFNDTVRTIQKLADDKLVTCAHQISLPAREKAIARAYFERCREESVNGVTLAALFQPLRRCFERALQHDATAWVCTTDSVAIPALEFLKTRGINVPSQLSVVGFDNNITSMTNQLTSYEFNIGSTIRAAVEHCLGNDAHFHGDNSPSIFFNGEIVTRGTVASRDA